MITHVDAALFLQGLTLAAVSAVAAALYRIEHRLTAIETRCGLRNPTNTPTSCNRQ